MSNLVLATPTKLLLPVGVEKYPEFDKLRKALSYEDKRITYQYITWKKIQKQDDLFLSRGGTGRRHWFVAKNGRQALDDKVNQLFADKHGTCIKQDSNGRYWTYSGLKNTVGTILSTSVTDNSLVSPSRWKAIPWAKKPHEPRWYQQKSLDLLCPEDGSRTHGAVSIGTGLGKSLIMSLLVKRIGLETIVVVPTLSIAEQMLKDLKSCFGEGRVGQFFEGKKQSDKHILVAVAKSLMNVEEGSKDWNNIYDRKVLLCDESHTSPPDSLASVMFGLLANLPYRYFFSGTQFRNDGLGVLLQGIVGDCVFEMSVKQGIEERFLSPLKFFMWRITSSAEETPPDIIKINKLHLQQNVKVYKHAANLINRAVKEKNRRVLVLVDTVDQYQRLLDGGLQVDSRFAHGPLNKDNKETVPESQRKLVPMDLVKEFDDGKFSVLVATSCIGMGTDIKSVDFIVSIIGLTSEIEITQNIGRGTRLFPGKTDCHYHDYWVTNIEELDRHAKKRIDIFESIYGKCKILEAR